MVNERVTYLKLAVLERNRFQYGLYRKDKITFKPDLHLISHLTAYIKHKITDLLNLANSKKPTQF